VFPDLDALPALLVGLEEFEEPQAVTISAAAVATSRLLLLLFMAVYLYPSMS
jgi:hypothetical protein